MNRRRRFLHKLRMFGLVVATLLVLAAIGWTWANIMYARLLSRELAGLKQRGYPITIAEARPKPVPDDQNAATIYVKLFDVSFDGKTPYPQNGGLKRYELSGTGGMDLATAVASRELLDSARLQEVFDALEQASKRPYCVFPVRWEMGPATLFPHLEHLRQGGRLLGARAILDAHEGNLPQASDRLIVMYRIADQVTQEPTVIAQFVAYAIQAIADRAAHVIIAPANVPAGAARRLARALQPEHVEAGHRAALRMEFMFGLDFFSRYPVGIGGSGLPLRPVPKWHPLAPYLRLEQANYIRYFRLLVEQSDRPYRTTAASPLTIPEKGIGTMMASMMVPVFSKSNMKRDQSLAHLALLRWVLELKAHRREQRSYPGDLSSFRGLPNDPFSGKPPIYRREASGFLIYSVGPDLEDDGGREPIKPGDYRGGGDMTWRCPK